MASVYNMGIEEVGVTKAYIIEGMVDYYPILRAESKYLNAEANSINVDAKPNSILNKLRRNLGTAERTFDRKYKVKEIVEEEEINQNWTQKQLVANIKDKTW